MPLPKLLHFRDDLRMSTWLLIGASIQAFLVLLLPRRVAVAPAFLLLFSRAAVFFCRCQGYLKDSSLKNVYIGRSSTQILGPDGSFTGKPSDQEVTVMILGAQSNHVQGRFAPGFPALGDAFGDMWRDLSKNREHNGYLGKTSTLFATDVDSGNTMAWISYWRSAEHLHEWALSPVHRKGMETFIKVQKDNPHLAIMHELYSAPKHHWETIYINFRPFGFGQTKIVRSESGNPEETVSTLTSAEDTAWRNSKLRMGITSGKS